MMNFTLDENPITPEPGIYYDIPWEEYRRWNAFSKSMAEPALKSDIHLIRELMSHRRSTGMDFGSLVDCLLLEPHLFEARFAIQPDTYTKVESSGRGAAKVETVVTKPWDLRSNTCREIRDKLEATGKTVVSQKMLERAQNVVMVVQQHEEASAALKKAKRQVSLCWREPETGVLCKGRIDFVADEIWDLKTTVDASPEGFAGTINRFGYHMQAGIYSQAWEILTGKKLNFRFLAVESDPEDETVTPLVAVYEMLWDDRSMIVGRLKFLRACRAVAGYDHQKLRGYSPYAEPISIPEWAIWNEVNRHEEVEL